MDTSLRQLIMMIGTSTLVVVAIVVLAKVMGLESYYLEFLDWADSAGGMGKLLTGSLLMLSVVFLLPSIYLTMGAGLLYGVVEGSVIIVVTETIGAFIALTVGRMRMFDLVKGRLAETSAFAAIDSVVQRGGWELVSATRMVPFFPFKLSNYAFGITSVDTRSYLIGTFVGLWPIAVFNAYLGAIAGDVMSFNTTGLARTPAEWVTYITGFLMVLVLLYVTGKRARRRLKS